MLKPNLIKCPFCTGNTNDNRKTLYLFPDSGRYWCARKKCTGYLKDLANINLTFEPEQQTKIISPNWNNQGQRFSVCKNRNFDGVTDQFQIKDSSGKQKGIYTRYQNKKSNIRGKKYLGYREPFLTFTETYRVTEGPYDCIYPNDIATFGYPNAAQAKDLKNYNLVLCPDGDIWKDTKSVVQWFKPFLWNKIEYVERLPDDKDPDEIVESERRVIEWKELKKWIFLKLR